MKIGTNNNIVANRLINHYNSHLFKQNEAMSRVSTGLHIRSAKDNASTYAISEKMLSQIRAQTQANENAQTNASMLKTAQDGLSNDLDILTSIQAIAIKDANDSNTDGDRTKIVEEVKQLLKQIDDNALKVKFNGRQLLNGAADPTSGSYSGAVGTTAPEAVTATGKYGDKAVYSITGFTVADSAADPSGTGLKTAATDTELYKLLDSEGKALFNIGDKITVTWTENGAEKSKSLEVTNTAKLSDLSDLGIVFKKGADGTTAAEATGAKAADGSTDVYATENGYYVVGGAGKNISNLAFAVTNSSGATNTAAQAALKPTAVQQSYGDSNYGTNEVYTVAATAEKNNETSMFYEFGTADEDVEGSNYWLNVDGKQVHFSGSNTISEINDMLKQQGINVRLQYAEAGDKLYYDDQLVTKGTYGGVGDCTATDGLKFITAPGTSVAQISITSDAASGAFTGKSTNNGTNTEVITRELKLDATSEISGSSSSSSMSLLPRGNKLQLMVGGEANFIVDITIGKATVQNLFGTDSDSFANTFATKEGSKSAIDVVQKAIDKVLNEQALLGALEKRMGYISDGLESMNTNLKDANSVTRESDPAEDIVDYTKNAVLANMTQAMLAMSNQNAFGVGNLLKAFGF